MSVLKEVDFSRTSMLADQSFVRELVSEAFWKWYDQNPFLKITTIKIWVIKKDIYLYQLHSLFELLLGPRKSP